MKLSLSCLALASSLFVAAGAHASTISGTVYTGIPDWSNAADPANETGAAGSAQFMVGGGGIHYASPPSSYTVAGFLNHPGFTNKTGSFTTGDTADNMEVVITGSLTTGAGDVLSIYHDDGAVLYLDGELVISAPGPAFQGYNTYAGEGAGLHTFTLYYAEGNGKPADLTFADNGVTVGATPEPSSLILLGTGLATAAGFARRRFSRSA